MFNFVKMANRMFNFVAGLFVEEPVSLGKISGKATALHTERSRPLQFFLKQSENR